MLICACLERLLDLKWGAFVEMAKRISRVAASLFVTSLLFAVRVEASETLTYSYDALRRLTQVARSGTINNGASESYSYDKASDRTNVTASTSGGATTYPSFTIGSASATEGGALVFTVTRACTTPGNFSVSYATADGTAVSGSDYTAGPGTITFPAGTPALTVLVPTIDDSVAESTEMMMVNLTGATGGATIATATATGTITDNESVATPPSFAISDATGTEADTLVFTITKTGPTSSSFSVNFATANGSATGLDYTGTSGTLTFAPTETTKTISVITKTDVRIESTEYFYVNPSSATGGANLADLEGQGQILDDGLGGCKLC